jgi:hypothetical protein
VSRRHAFGLSVTTIAILFFGIGPAVAVPPVPSSPPPVAEPKETAPATDLEHYPKRQDEGGFKPAAGGTPQDQVLSRRTTADGQVEVTLFTPPPGLSNARLAADLRRQGVPNVEIMAAETTSADGEMSITAAGDCSYGTARTIDCPPPHWTNNGFADPQVYFNDHSGANWPVDAAVYTWNQAVGIDSYYRWNGCGPAGTHCVQVYSGNYGATGWAGRTIVTWSVTTNRISGARVELNDHYQYNADGLRQNACHELGHALGLGHNVQDYSCLWFQIKNSAHRVPDSDDFNMLASVYSIVR